MGAVKPANLDVMRYQFFITHFVQHEGAGLDR